MPQRMVGSSAFDSAERKRQLVGASVYSSHAVRSEITDLYLGRIQAMVGKGSEDVLECNVTDSISLKSRHQRSSIGAVDLIS